jgi:hypothetical protein
MSNDRTLRYISELVKLLDSADIILQAALNEIPKDTIGGEKIHRKFDNWKTRLESAGSEK